MPCLAGATESKPADSVQRHFQARFVLEPLRGSARKDHALFGGVLGGSAAGAAPLALVVLPQRSVLGEGGLLPFRAQSGFVIGLVTST